MRHDAVAEKSIDALARSIKKLIRNHKVERLVFFLERTDRGNRQDALHAQLFEAVNVGAEVQFGGQEAMSASVARKERDFPPFECAENIGVRRIAERSFVLDFADTGLALQVIKPAASGVPYLRFCQTAS